MTNRIDDCVRWILAIAFAAAAFGEQLEGWLR